MTAALAVRTSLLITAHVHLLLVGCMPMMVMGVATWMFPRPAKAASRDRPELAEAVYWVITGSTALRAGAEVAAGLFVANMWWRVRMPVLPRPPEP